MKRLNIKIALKRAKSYVTESAETLSNPAQVRFRDVWSKINQVEGWLLRDEGEWLFRTARSLPDGTKILEIGAFKGKSTLCLAYGCLGTTRRVFSVDRFKGVYADVDGHEDLSSIFAEGFFDEWKSNIERNGVLEYVTPIIGDSREIAQTWTAPVHMLFIDGSHQFEDAMADFANFYPRVVPNGIIAVHDVTPEWEGPYRAWHEHIKHRLQNTGAISALAYGKKPL